MWFGVNVDIHAELSLAAGAGLRSIEQSTAEIVDSLLFSYLDEVGKLCRCFDIFQNL